MCLYPKLISNRKYTSNKKNKGNIPALPTIVINGKTYEDRRVLTVPVGCGKCMECMKQKSNEWRVRLLEEVKDNKNGVFVTLTFEPKELEKLGKLTAAKGYQRDNEIATIAVRRFLERWRKKHKKSVKHWLVTELGQENTEHVHLHGIIWTDKGGEEIENHWQYGMVWDSERKGGWVNEQTVNYIVKYVHKTDEKHTLYKPKILTSAGIGKGYLDRHNSKKNKFKDKNTDESYRTRSGLKMGLPTYYRNKIYTEEQREKLWTNKLDEEIRWVGGEKIDVSKGEEDYIKTREFYRRKNKELGYGDDKLNWDEIKYQNERRNIKFMEKIRKLKNNS